ncbi:hypothetical protein QTI17_01380 [Variovorax sp. J31P179]|uniref:hypothetical protein n=1 Tax=Variovorax sp. J31P179 TaxID=3053508 RepID=UPI002577A1F9|nr:hypothetical protein [Variovorax sp. J31P179]MDM0079233.1 hypothetical protein [Variovorax sp. J31P179]
MSGHVRIDVRREFSACVSKMGGTVNDDVLAARPDNKPNADFVFAADDVVAELKCLETDWAAELAAHAPARTDDWMRRGKLRRMSGSISLEDLPLPLVREILEPFRKRLKSRIVARAAKQIKQSRLDIARPSAKGLLIIVNDGNRALAPDMMAPLLLPILNSGSYSAIHTVLYMSVNEPVTVGGPFGQAQFWMPWSIKGKESVSQDFVDRLGDAWMAHLSSVTGDPVFQLSSTVSIEKMQFAAAERQHRYSRLICRA